VQCAFAHSWGKGATCFVVPRRPIYACGVNQDRPVVISPREGVLEGVDSPVSFPPVVNLCAY